MRVCGVDWQSNCWNYVTNCYSLFYNSIYTFQRMINHHRITWSVYRARERPDRDKKTGCLREVQCSVRQAGLHSTSRGRCDLELYFVYLKNVPDFYEFRYRDACEGSILVLFSLASNGKITRKTIMKYLQNKTVNFNKKLFPINFRK